MKTLSELVDINKYPINDRVFQDQCRSHLDQESVLALQGFLRNSTLEELVDEANRLAPQAYFRPETHNVYLMPQDSEFADDHARNMLVTSSKGCVCDDIVPQDSHLKSLHASDEFKSFLCNVLGEEALYPYADALSSINVHYAREGEELGWHFDNSSFAVTLMLQAPKKGGAFEYVADLRDADSGEMNYDGVRRVLTAEVPVQQLSMPAGTLVLFRGRNALHRVAPVEGDTARMLVVLAYNSAPDISLSESARQTFYGRLG